MIILMHALFICPESHMLSLKPVPRSIPLFIAFSHTLHMSKPRMFAYARCAAHPTAAFPDRHLLRFCRIPCIIMVADVESGIDA